MENCFIGWLGFRIDALVIDLLVDYIIIALLFVVVVLVIGCLGDVYDQTNR